MVTTWDSNDPEIYLNLLRDWGQKYIKPILFIQISESGSSGEVNYGMGGSGMKTGREGKELFYHFCILALEPAFHEENRRYRE